MFRRQNFIMILTVVFVLFIMTACGNNAAPVDNQAPQNNSSNNSNNSSNSSSGTNDSSYNITIAGGSPGGFFSVMTEGYANIVRSASPNTQIGVEPGDVSTGIVNLMEGSVQVAWAQIAEAAAAFEGKEPFPAPLEVKVMFTAWTDNPFQFVIEEGFAEEYGIESLEDILRVKPPIRIGVNVKGILTEAIFNDTINELGFSYEDIESWGGSIFHTNVASASEEMQNQKLDFFAMPVFAPNSNIIALANHRDLRMIGIGNDDVMNKVADSWKLEKTVIPAGTYDFVTEDIDTYAISGMALVAPDAPEDMVYDLTKLFFENLDDYRALHQSLADLTPEKAANSTLPLHPGAEKYMKEQGYLP